MACGLPPGRAGCAPQASRHSSGAEVAAGASGREVGGASGESVDRRAPVAEVAGGFGVKAGREPVADAETERVRAADEQALANAAKPTLPANRSR
jgi:hypothetical protein